MPSGGRNRKPQWSSCVTVHLTYPGNEHNIIVDFCLWDLSCCKSIEKRNKTPSKSVKFVLFCAAIYPGIEHIVDFRRVLLAGWFGHAKDIVHNIDHLQHKKHTLASNAFITHYFRFKCLGTKKKLESCYFGHPELWVAVPNKRVEHRDTVNRVTYQRTNIPNCNIPKKVTYQNIPTYQKVRPVGVGPLRTRLGQVYSLHVSHLGDFITSYFYFVYLFCLSTFTAS